MSKNKLILLTKNGQQNIKKLMQVYEVTDYFSVKQHSSHIPLFKYLKI